MWPRRFVIFAATSDLQNPVPVPFILGLLVSCGFFSMGKFLHVLKADQLYMILGCITVNFAILSPLRGLQGFLELWESHFPKALYESPT